LADHLELTGREPARAMRRNLQTFFDRVRWDHGDMEISVLSVGEDPSTATYMRSIERTFGRYQIPVQARNYPADSGAAEFYHDLSELQSDPSLHGVIILKPLPESFTVDFSGPRNLPYVAAVQSHLDLECISPRRIMDLALGYSEMAPPTAGAVLWMLDHNQIPISGRRVVVVGRSGNVGRPIGWLLLQRNATLTYCHSKTTPEQLRQVTRSADILVTATGNPGMITADLVRPGAVVLDAGFSFVGSEVRGDVDFDGVSKVAAAITPVPGGIGPLTNELLAHNLATLVSERYGLKAQG
jgi:methylenetetrahydrofolate dehydrogenase (NADP+)/methenyltetrahydrofolate cyclohydrolase